LDNHRRELIVSSARALDKAKMIRFDERTTYLSPIDVGRIASNFYIKYDTIEVLYMSLTNFKADFKVKVALFMLDHFFKLFSLEVQ
jgi:activating signal cointegrator complex subunit 3